MNELDQYVYDCVSLGKRPGGVKIGKLKKKVYSRVYSDMELYDSGQIDWEWTKV